MLRQLDSLLANKDHVMSTLIHSHPGLAWPSVVGFTPRRSKIVGKHRFCCYNLNTACYGSEMYTEHWVAPCEHKRRYVSSVLLANSASQANK